MSAARRAAPVVPAAARAFLSEPAPRGYSLGLHAFCKVNLGLAVGRRRAGGFHEVSTLLQTIDLADTLYARPRARGLVLRIARRGPARRLGLPVARGASNLVLRAARRVREAVGERGGAEILLVKRVPAGSGLGGGSSDAAATIRLLERLWDRALGTRAERRLAAELGSDCAFFLEGGRARASGRGERLARLPVPRLERLLLALPRAGVSTARAYRLLDESRGNSPGALPPSSQSNRLTPRTGVRKILGFRALRTMSPGARSLLRNDFEEVIARHYPDVRAARRFLAERGAGIPRMSGSGSAVFAVLPPGARPSGVVTRRRQPSFEVVLARFTRVGSLWCR